MAKTKKNTKIFSYTTPHFKKLFHYSTFSISIKDIIMLLMEIKLLIFDFDGTLFDTSDSIAHVVNFTLRKFNKRELDKKTIWTYTGDGLKKTIERAFKDCDKSYYRRGI